jgi:hypothetical protein
MSDESTTQSAIRLEAGEVCINQSGSIVALRFEIWEKHSYVAQNAQRLRFVLFSND